MLVAFTLVFGAAATASASNIRQSGKFGVGVGSGTTTNGLSGKYFLGTSTALQVTVGGNGFDFGGLHVGADYLFEMPPLATGSVLDVAWNAGIGAGAVIGDPLILAVSGVIGLELLFKPVPIDLVFEYRPSVLLIPKVGFGFGGFTGHLRWYF
ncbi:MAG: hypothetical protein KC502_23785 [Myxococcales bacterium]|nr:hypothetical protein [Myxococcales bacterium]